MAAGAWDAPAATLAMLINTSMNCDPDAGFAEANDWNPFRRARSAARPKAKMPLSILRPIVLEKTHAEVVGDR